MSPFEGVRQTVANLPRPFFRSTCRLKFGVTFPIFANTSVVAANANSLYRAMAAQSGKLPRSNFHEYPVNRGRQRMAVFESAVKPTTRK
jgi:glutathione peroxidase